MITLFTNKALRLMMAAVISAAALSPTISPARAASVIILTSNKESYSGDGLCSLREAIIAANTDSAVDACPAGSGADTIILPAGVYTLSTAGINEDAALTGDLDITQDLALIGDGSATTTIDANAVDRALQIIGTPVVEISGVTITGGDAGPSSGGGIRNDAGTLTLTDSQVDGNTARLGFGGGIANFLPATLSITDSSVDDNTAGFGDGGGIFNEGTLILTNSSVDGNTAHYTGGGIANAGTATLTDISLGGNSALGGSGGGISNTRMAPPYDNSSGIVIITRSIVEDNSALAHGGGIRNDATLTFTSSTLSGNSANLDGGGIYNSDTATFTNSTLSGNSADGDGGGIANSGVATFTNSTVSGDSAVNGGGIYDSGEASLHNVTIAHNTAGIGGSGGGVYIDPLGTLSIGNSIIARNVNNGLLFLKPDCSGKLSSLGYNLIQDFSGCSMTGLKGNLLGVLPFLGPLQANGGPTFTHALLPNSPAIDAGNPSGCKDDNGGMLTTDQRGYARPKDGNGDKVKVCDMGAFEY